jgi:hypothetical protein
MYQPFPGGAEPPEPALATIPPSIIPPSITRAVRVMYAGAAASVIGIIIDLTTYGTLQNALATRRRKNGQLMTHAQVVDLAHVEVVAFVVGGLIAAALWIAMARSNRAGKSWARTVSTVLFAISTVSAFVSIGGGALATVDATRIYGFVVWIIGLAAIILLWQRASSEYFKGFKGLQGAPRY